MTGSNQKGFLRLLLAISVPETVREELCRFQNELRALLPPHSVRWAKADQFHLTLKFFGDVSSADVSVLREAARSVCVAAPPIFLRAEGVGFFPNKFSPQVFWVDIKNPDRQLARLQQQLEDATRSFAEKQEEKKFTAHVTLARFEKLSRSDVEKIVVHPRTDKFLGEWTTQEIQLMQSTLQPTGALHAILDAFRTKNSETFF